MIYTSNTTGTDIAVEGLRLYGQYSAYTSPPANQGGGIDPAKRWTVKDCIIEDFNCFGM